MWDYAERRTREQRYRLMFRSAIAILVLSVLFGAAGVLLAIRTAELSLLAISALLADTSILLGYKVVSSTVRILELDAEETGGGWFAPDRERRR